MARNYFAKPPTPSAPLQSGSGGTGQTTYTAGDILIAKADGKLYRKAIGSNGQVLTIDTTDPQKTKWATPSSGGSAPSWTLLNTITVGSVASVTVSNPGTKKHLLIVATDLSTIVDGTSDYAYLRHTVQGTGINSPSTADYKHGGNNNHATEITPQVRGFTSGGAKLNFKMLLRAINTTPSPAMNLSVYSECPNSSSPLFAMWRYWATSFSGIDFTPYYGGGGAISFTGGTIKLYGTDDDTL